MSTWDKSRQRLVVILSCTILFSSVAQAGTLYLEDPSGPSGSSPSDFSQKNDQVNGLIEFKNDSLDSGPFLAAAGSGYRPPDFFYNGDGTLDRVVYYDETGTRSYEDQFTSFTGILTIVQGFLNNGSVTCRTIFDPSGMIQRIIHFSTQGTTDSVEFYDPLTGLVFSREGFGAQGLVSDRLIYSDGKKVRWDTFVDDSILRSRTLYDSAEQPVVTEWFDVEGRLERRDEYGGEGRVSRSCFYAPDGSLLKENRTMYSDTADGLWSQTTIYDGEGRRIGTEQTMAGKLRSRETIDAATDKVLQRDWFLSASTGSGVFLFRKVSYAAEGTASVTEYDEAGAVVSVNEAGYLVNVSLVKEGMVSGQTALGLISSHPDDTGYIFVDGVQQEWAKILSSSQAYTYDQAVAAIAFLDQGDLGSAQSILDFFYNEWQTELAIGNGFTGFYTVYNVDPVYWWKKYEWRKGAGENAWIGLMALNYYASATDEGEKARALDLAKAIARWLSSLPHSQGAIAMGQHNTGIPDWGSLYSVENNLDYYALLKGLLPLTTGEDYTLFNQEKTSLITWLKNEAYDSETGLFKRGGEYDSGTGGITWGSIHALDVNSWAILSIGIPDMIAELGLDIDAFVAGIHDAFLVGADRRFSAEPFDAKGFDFSDYLNASRVPRDGMKWAEGTNGMILVYKKLAAYYRLTDPAKASYYQGLADAFEMRIVEDAAVVAGQLGFLYSDQAGVQVFFDTPDWRTSPGRSLAADAWTLFALNGTNPLG